MKVTSKVVMELIMSLDNDEVKYLLTITGNQSGAMLDKMTTADGERYTAEFHRGSKKFNSDLYDALLKKVQK